MNLYKAILATLSMCSYCVLAQAADNPIGELFATINQRLSYMESVALSKRQTQTPVEDLPREQIVIANANGHCYMNTLPQHMFPLPTKTCCSTP